MGRGSEQGKGLVSWVGVCGSRPSPASPFPPSLLTPSVKQGDACSAHTLEHWEEWQPQAKGDCKQPQLCTALRPIPRGPRPWPPMERHSKLLLSATRQCLPFRSGSRVVSHPGVFKLPPCSLVEMSKQDLSLQHHPCPHCGPFSPRNFDAHTLTPRFPEVPSWPELPGCSVPGQSLAAEPDNTVLRKISGKTEESGTGSGWARSGARDRSRPLSFHYSKLNQGRQETGHDKVLRNT